MLGVSALFYGQALRKRKRHDQERLAAGASQDVNVEPLSSLSSEVDGMISSRLALATSLAALFLAACGGSQLTTGALSAAVQLATHSSEQSFHGYYLAKFTDVVGSTIPFSSLCLRFKSSGTWSSVPPNAFIGTYLTSGNELFASALAPWSPTIYATLQGSVNGTQGSGDYIVMQPNGSLYSGGTFTMTRAGKNHC
jgi:hypothetical protein